MFDYLQKFNSLPKDLRDRVSSPSVMAAVTELENKYKVDLAMTVMKVMIKSLALKDLPAYFISDFSLTPPIAENLTRELKEKVFFSVSEYLGLTAAVRAFDLDRDIEVLIKEAGLILPSANLVSRFKNILAIYLRGVRSKIDTRSSLAKDVKIGGLNLSPAEIDRVLKVCDGKKIMGSAPSQDSTVKTAPVKAPAMFSLPPEEYDLKRALESGATKPVVKEAKILNKLDPGHEIVAPVKQLDLAAPQKQPDLPRVPVKPIPSPVAHPIIHQTPQAPQAPQAPQTPQAPQMSQARRETPGLAPLKVPVAPVAPVKPVVSSAATTSVKKQNFFAGLFHKKKVVSAPPIVKQVPSATKPTTPVKNIVPPPPAQVADRRPNTASSATRPQMHDVKPVPKVMGPIEELQFLDPLNFRRLGKTPEETTAKIFAKIKLLEKEGYDKMVSGVRAWRQSPTNRLYLRLGQEAIASGVFLKDAVATRQKAGQECLSMEEIEAIVNLNSKLVF